MLPHDVLARVIDARPTTCPNTYAAGCRCWEHNPGLLAHATDPTAFLAFLPDGPAPPRPSDLTCNADPMVCDCPQHGAERAAAIASQRAAQRIRQPWES